MFYDVCSNVRSECVGLGSYHMGQKKLMNSFPHYGAECPCRDKVIKML